SEPARRRSLSSQLTNLRSKRLAGEKSLATSDVSGILNAPALNPLRRVFVFIFNAFEVPDGAGIESKILK
ncbi:hypothetical protein ACFEB4_005179, partial [Escherichia coli]